MCRRFIYLTFFFAFCTTAIASDIAFYVGQWNTDGWYDGSQFDDVATIIDQTGHMFNDIQQFDDDELSAFGTWVDNNTNDGEMDIIWLNGCTPSVLYQFPNVNPDGSRAEEWLDNGNMIINIGDWFAYCSFEGGSRQSDNGSAGAANILDLDASIIAGGAQGAMVVTSTGQTYLPSLNQVTSDRPVLLSAVVAPWEVAAIFAQNAAGTYADPVVIHNTATDGYLVVINQGGSGNWIAARGLTCAEFIYNWVGTLWGLKPLAKARDPNPPDGATGVTSPLLSWAAGVGAKWHDVYLGTDEIAVTNATSSDPMGPAEVYKARQVQAWNMWYEMAGWVSGTTYYWRVDEVEADGTTINRGYVWSFTAAPLEAYSPDPPDGAKWVDLQPTLTWFPGAAAVTHDVYFGTDQTDVTNGTGGTFKGNLSEATYDPGTLTTDTTYYWRIDGKDNFGTVYPGAVWSFTTVGPYAGAIGSYYEWTSATVPPDRSVAFANLVMTRIDPQIDFYWASGSPAGVRADQFAAKWVADLESPTSEPYTIWTLTDDGVRVWVDEVLVIDNWTEHGDTWNSSAQIDFVAGQTYSLEMEWYENGGGAVAELHWSSPSIPRQPIPSGALQLPLKASKPDPANGATGVTDTPTLRWKAGMQAAQHQVFFGTDENAVANADTTTAGIYRGSQSLENTSYVPSEVPLDWEKTYYWKVNEANGVELWEGTVWSFTVADYLIIDDFEDYDDYCNRIFYTYGDGWGHSGDVSCGVPPYAGNGTGSTVGYLSEPYAEQTITHDGSFQSMPMEYLNDGSTGKALYSETERTFDPVQDWTRRGVKALTLWFQGQAGSPNRFEYDAGSDVYTVTARSGDIWNAADSFHYVYKRLSGAGSIQAKVLNVTVGVAAWTKVGVMIREDLEPNSPHAFSMLTPPGRTALQHRAQRGQRSYSAHSDEGKITYPYWVKIERTGNNFTAYYSADGTTWVPQPNDENLDTDPEATNPANIPMNSNTYIGLALSSGNTAGTAQAEFSNVTSTGTVTGSWQSQNIGIASNDAERLYVALEDSSGRVKDVPHPNPNAVQLDTWQEWNIALADFAPVDLTKIKKMYIGVGNRDFPTLGGAGMLYVDDIRLYEPRCMPSLARPPGGFNNDCVVDYLDLDIMTNGWLVSTYDVTPDGSALSTGLIGHYKLDGNLNDIVGGNNGTKEGAGAAAYVAGMDGQAIDVDGIDDYIETNVNATDLGIAGNSAKSVTAWVYTRGFNHGGIFDMGTNENGRNFSLRTYNIDNVWRAQRWGYPTYDFDFEYDSLDKWVHFALVYGGAAAGDESWAYADGNLVGSQIAAMDTDGAGRTFRIGVWSGYYFDGLIDDVRVYNRALSQAEAASLAGRTTTFTQPMYPLIDPMDADSGDVDMNGDGTVDLKDYALLADTFLDEKLWP
jgi:hypothetical protein